MMRSTAIRFGQAAALGAAMLASPALAGTEVETASAALAFWMTWGIVYLAIGGVLVVLAAAIGVREEREWSSLLRWTEDEQRALSGRDDGERTSRRAA